MWYLEKDVTISAAHRLNNYEGKCKNLHGHSWHITVYCKGKELQDNGILVDFATIKAAINSFDHTHLNEKLSNNPTAENLAKKIFEMLPLCHKVMVQEEEGSRCFYVKD